LSTAHEPHQQGSKISWHSLTKQINPVVVSGARAGTARTVGSHLEIQGSKQYKNICLQFFSFIPQHSRLSI
jgi:hypothetical protein